ncbi:MAG: hypothetical protein PHW79_04080 [Candidatus Marinimicrobia bacterium]|nr:hypothetical protein [Candidatus Neomarinimicrobiota bacterium]
MKRSIQIILIALIASAVVIPQSKMKYDGTRYTGEIVKKFDVQSGGSLDMRNMTGDITVVGEQRNDVEIQEKYRIDAYSESAAGKILQDEKANYLQKGNNVTVEGTDHHSRRYDSKFNVKIPVAFNVIIKTSGGDLSLDNMQGRANMHTSGGDIEISDVKGEINGSTSGGDITVDRIVGVTKVTTSGGDIKIQHHNGNLWGKTSGGDINVNDLKGDGDVFTSGGDIDIQAAVGKILNARTSGGNIGLINIDAIVDVSTSGGDIVADEVKKDFKLSTSGGDIEIKKVGGKVDAHTSGGDIYVGEVFGFCKVSTSGGDIEVGKAGKDLVATTSGGDIVILGVVGSLNARTSGGNIEARKLYASGVTDNSITMASSGGDLMLYLPLKIKAVVSAEIEVTHRRDVDSDINSDFPLTINKIEKGSRLLITGHGLINGGGDDIKLNTSDGNIRIRKINGN